MCCYLHNKGDQVFLVPRLLSFSLDENVRAKEGGKETTGETRGETALRLPSVPFPWSLAVHHQSLAFRTRLYHAKHEAPEEEAGIKLLKSQKTLTQNREICKFCNFAIARKTVKSAAPLFASFSRKIVNFVNFVAEFNPGHKGILEMFLYMYFVTAIRCTRLISSCSFFAIMVPLHQARVL